MEQVGVLRGRRQVGRLNLLFILPKGGFYLLKSLAADGRQLKLPERLVDARHLLPTFILDLPFCAPV